MSVNIPNQVPFLRQQRLFPQDSQALSVEIDRMYCDVASATNSRIIGSFTSNQPTQSGEVWYQNGLRYQGFRKFYNFTAAGSYAHGISFDNVFAFTKIYGTVADNASPPNWYPLSLIDTTNVNKQVSLQVTSSNIVITFGAGAITPTQIIVVLEWISFS